MSSLANVIDIGSHWTKVPVTFHKGHMMTAVSSAAEIAAIEAVNEVIDGESTAIVSVAAVAAAARRRSTLDISEEKLEEIIIAMATVRYLAVQFDGRVPDALEAK